jgi:hypothetical protein
MSEPCKKHPRYQAKRKPASKCRSCWGLWEWAKSNLAKPAPAAPPPRQPIERAPDYNLPGVTWTGHTDSQKKQEFNRTMGHVADLLRDVAAGETPDPENAKRCANYIAQLTADEAIYLNKRLARAVSLGHAREMLFLQRFEHIAAKAFQGKITPQGYATKRSAKPTKRICTLHLSDLHVGATIDGAEFPEGFDFHNASRRLARLALEAADFKRQYRDHTTLHLLLNGDVIEGLLGHDQADGAPLSEQCVAFTRFAADVIAYLAAAFPQVHVFCETGNHGRNKLRHEGRATNQKWDSTETVLYKFLERLFRDVGNVRFSIPKSQEIVIPLFDKHMLMTHGDTALKLGPPDTKAELYEAALNRMNGNLTYGAHIDLLTIGHYHTPRHMIFKRGEAVVNGALVPPNGFARAMGAETPCGQWIWESVPGHAFGDARYLRVGPKDDADASLDAVVAPFKW